MTGRRPGTFGSWVCALAGVVLLVANCGVAGRPVTAAPARSAVSPGSTGTRGPSVTASDVAYPLGLTLYPPDRRRLLSPVRGRTLDGTPLTVNGLHGHVVVVNVWASWCLPCRTESPALAALSRSAGASRVRFVGVDENDTPAAATTFLHSVGSTYPHLVDDGTLLSQLSTWLPKALPGSLVLDRQGRVAARIIGQASIAQLQPLLSQLSG